MAINGKRKRRPSAVSETTPKRCKIDVLNHQIQEKDKTIKQLEAQLRAKIVQENELGEGICLFLKEAHMDFNTSMGDFISVLQSLKSVDTKCPTSRIDGKIRGYAIMTRDEEKQVHIKVVCGLSDEVEKQVSSFQETGYAVVREFQKCANTDDFIDNVRYEGQFLLDLHTSFRLTEIPIEIPIDFSKMPNLLLRKQEDVTVEMVLSVLEYAWLQTSPIAAGIESVGRSKNTFLKTIQRMQDVADVLKK